MDCIQAIATGATITTGAASARVAIPNCAAGTAPGYVRLSATASAYVKMGLDNTVVAAAGDLMVQPGDSVVVRANTFTYVAAIQVTAAGIVQISPLDNV